MAIRISSGAAPPSLQNNSKGKLSHRGTGTFTGPNPVPKVAPKVATTKPFCLTCILPPSQPLKVSDKTKV